MSNFNVFTNNSVETLALLYIKSNHNIKGFTPEELAAKYLEVFEKISTVFEEKETEIANSFVSQS